MPIERNDLNLFRVFDTVMRHRNLVAAGRELGISASAVSHALTRLRAALSDDLFVAGDRKITPTARAFEVASKIASGLANFDDVLASKDFNPKTADRAFKIGASDYNARMLLPSLLPLLLVQAPTVRLRMSPIGRDDLVEQLDEGRLDAVLSWFGQMPERIRRKQLFVDREAIVVRRGHPLNVDGPSRAMLLTFPHLVVELTGTNELSTGGFYNERGLQRRVWIERLMLETKLRDKAEAMTRITVPNYDLVPPLVRCTDLVATLPFRLARQMCAETDLVMLDLPYQPLEVVIEVGWHERSDRDSALQWLLDLFVVAANGLGMLPPSDQILSAPKSGQSQ